MERLINSVELSVKTENWYAALITILTLPDIAGKIEYSGYSSNKRYSEWFDKYVGDKYKSKIGPDRVEHVFLSGNDCYALRCSFLHEGKSEIVHQRARDILEDFEFIVPPKGSIIHCNQMNNKLQLQVDIFCSDIIIGLKKWLNDIAVEPNKINSLNDFLKIYGIK